MSLDSQNGAGVSLGESCIICCSSVEVSKPSVVNSGPKLLSEKLQNYFVLRHILDIPEYQLSYYLSLNSGSKEWIKLCLDCTSRYVRKCFTLYSELKKTELKLSQLKIKIKQEVKKSVKQKFRRVSSTWSITEEARWFVYNHNDFSRSIPDQNPFQTGDKLAKNKATQKNNPGVNYPTELKTEPEAAEPTQSDPAHSSTEDIGVSGDTFLNNPATLGDGDLQACTESVGANNIPDEDDSRSLADDNFQDETRSDDDNDPDYSAPVPKSPAKHSPPKPPQNRKSSKRLKTSRGARPSKPKTLYCRRCITRFTSLDEYQNHRNNLTCLRKKPNRLFSCPHCRKQFTYEGNCKIHIIACPAAPADQLGASTGNPEDAIVDSISTPIGEPTCPKCNFTFLTRSKLLAHLRKGKCFSKATHKCSKCGRSFLRVSGLKQHKCEPLHFCDQCPFKSTRAYVVHFHKTSKHGQESTSAIQDTSNTSGNISSRCPRCQRKFPNKAHFVVHIAQCRVPEGGLKGRKRVRGKPSKNWMCDRCEKRFISPGLLQNHIDSFHLHKILLCPDCGFQSKSHKSFRKHCRINHGPDTHTANRTCPICNKIFSAPGNMKLHMEKIHNYEFNPETKVVICQLCGVGLTARQSLTRHMAVRHDIMEEGQGHICKHCGRRFPYKSKLSRHEKICESSAGRRERKKELPREENSGAAEALPQEERGEERHKREVVEDDGENATGHVVEPQSLEGGSMKI